MGLERAEVVALYERYLARCNEHRAEELGEFVSEFPVVRDALTASAPVPAATRPADHGGDAR
jgi:hypothetical protein